MWTSSGLSAPEPLQWGQITFLLYVTSTSFPIYSSSRVTRIFRLNEGPVYSYCYRLNTLHVLILIKILITQKCRRKYFRTDPSVITQAHLHTLHRICRIYGACLRQIVPRMQKKYLWIYLQRSYHQDFYLDATSKTTLYKPSLFQLERLILKFQESCRSHDLALILYLHEL